MMQKNYEKPGVVTRRTNDKVVTAFFDDPEDANRAYLQLQSEGYPPDDVTVAANSRVAGRDLAVTEQSKAPEGAATGAATGVTVGAIAGALAVAGAVFLPGIGWVAGPLVGALAGAGVGGAAGTLVGALVGLGMPEHEARVVQDAVREGGVVLAVHAAPERSDRVKDILKANRGRALSMS